MSVALLSLACLGCVRAARLPGTNLVLISIDTLRADHLSLYGYDRPTSPFLDELADESVVFDTFVMNGGFTLPSHMTMMTSLLPSVHGVRPHENELLPDARTTLAEVLKAGGYRTAAFVDAGWMRGKFGFTQGFDLYDDVGGHLEKTLPKAFDWLDRNHDGEPFFLFLHSMDVHSQWGGLPYGCPAPYPDRYTGSYSVDFDGCRNGKCASRLFKWIVTQTREGKLTATDVLTPEEIELSAALYDGCINYVDAKIREVVERLESYGVLDRTLVVVTSDHGEEFFEHGMLLHSQTGFEELAHVPLLIRFPRGELGGRRVPHLAAMVDLMPTLLDVLGQPPSPEAQGLSLLPAIAENRAVRSETTIWEVLRTRRWKYLPETRMLFDLAHDPHEQHNLWDGEPGMVHRLAARQQQHMARNARLAAILNEGSGVPASSELTEDEVRELKALGYLE